MQFFAKFAVDEDMLELSSMVVSIEVSINGIKDCLICIPAGFHKFTYIWKLHYNWSIIRSVLQFLFFFHHRNTLSTFHAKIFQISDTVALSLTFMAFNDKMHLAASDHKANFTIEGRRNSWDAVIFFMKNMFLYFL